MVTNLTRKLLGLGFLTLLSLYAIFSFNLQLGLDLKGGARIVYAFDFQILPLSENIGHRALVYVEEYALAAGMRSADALIAATAVERNLELVSSNTKHFKAVGELRLKAFRP